MSISYEHYIRTRACCVPGAGPAGPAGPAGETQIETATLFFSDLEMTDSEPFTTYLDYDNNSTTNNGKQRFMDGTGGSAGITFSDATIGLNGAYVELYFHGDMKTENAGQDNWIIFEMVGSDQLESPIAANSLATVDIDTRSVQKGELLHMAFGPSAHRLVENANTSQTLCIDKASTYRVRVRAGRQYNLSELRLVIKVIQY